MVAAEVGEKAPGFTLPADAWESTVSLEEHTRRRRGAVVLLYKAVLEELEKAL